MAARIAFTTLGRWCSSDRIRPAPTPTMIATRLMITASIANEMARVTKPGYGTPASGAVTAGVAPAADPGRLIITCSGPGRSEAA